MSSKGLLDSIPCLRIMSQMRLYLIIIAILFSTLLSAKEHEHTVQGRVLDSFSGENLPNVTLTLMDRDSVPIATQSTWDVPEAPELSGMFQFKVTKKGQYILKATSIGYESTYTNFELRSNRENMIFLNPIRLRKNIYHLPEVTVRATKVKMIYSGDTIIYNADAFKLAEGSMLDGLIRQLPGAKIDGEGVISVNGKFVESLLVNGRDFFQGNPKIALENLPAYTVGKIKLYQRNSPSSQLMNRSIGNQAYVMDVRLKKEYSVGNLGNLVAGAGTSERYNAQALVTRFSEQGHLSAILNFNNCNDNRMSGFDKEWRESQRSAGLQALKTIGVDYVRSLSKVISFYLSNTYSYTDKDILTKSNSQTFLNGSNAFNSTSSAMRSKLGTWHTASKLDIQKQGFFSQNKINATFAKNEHISTRTSEALFNTMVIYNSKRKAEEDGNNISVAIKTENGIKLVTDMLRLNGSFQYNRNNSDVFSTYNIQYTDNSANTTYRNDHQTSPVQNLTANIEIAYDYCLYKQILRPYYKYTYQYIKSRKELYLQNSFNVIDVQNSYVYREHRNDHFGGLEYTNDIGRYGFLSLKMPLRWTDWSLDAYRCYNQYIGKRHLFFEPYFFIRFMPPGYWISLTMHYTNEIPNLPLMLDYRDDSNPLRVQTGNMDLDNIRHFDIKAEFRRNYSNSSAFYTNLHFRMSDNSIVYGYSYNKKTGVITTKPENVNGNWLISADAGCNTHIDKAKKTSIDLKLKTNYERNVDIAAVSDGAKDWRSKVGIWTAETDCKIRFQPNGKMMLGLNGSLRWNNITSNRPEFTKISVTDFSFGGSMIAELPWTLQINTDITEYLHRGYHISEMNTSELIWDICLTKRLVKDKLYLSVKAFDLFRQISRHSFFVNEHGRTETWSNCIPRYAMLTMSWRFNNPPKKKNVKQ